MIEVKIHYPISRRVDEPGFDRVRVKFVLPKKPFLFWRGFEIGEAGEALDLPRGYGVAWVDFPNARTLQAPKPLNVIVALCIWLWQFVEYELASWLSRSAYNKRVKESLAHARRWLSYRQRGNGQP